MRKIANKFGVNIATISRKFIRCEKDNYIFFYGKPIEFNLGWFLCLVEEFIISIRKIALNIV